MVNPGSKVSGRSLPAFVIIFVFINGDEWAIKYKAKFIRPLWELSSVTRDEKSVEKCGCDQPKDYENDPSGHRNSIWVLTYALAYVLHVVDSGSIAGTT